MPKYVYQDVNCPFCERICKSTGLHRHIKSHGEFIYQEWTLNKSDKNRKSKTESWNLSQDPLNFQCSECDFVGKSKKSLLSHYWRAHTESGNKHKSLPKIKKKRIAWNKGLTKETDERVLKNSISVSKTQQKQISDGSYIPRKMGNKAKKELSERQSLKNSGGRCKWFQVDGVNVQGTWERDIALKLTDLSVVWEKPKLNQDIWKYEVNGSMKSYTPDFYLPDYNCWLEIKGFWWGNDLEKMRIVKETYPERKIIIIEKQEYKQILSGEQVWL